MLDATDGWSGERKGEPRGGTGKVGEDDSQTAELSVQFLQQPRSSVLILKRDRVHQHSQHQAQGCRRPGAVYGRTVLFFPHRSRAERLPRLWFAPFDCRLWRLSAAASSPPLVGSVRATCRADGTTSRSASNADGPCTRSTISENLGTGSPRTNCQLFVKVEPIGDHGGPAGRCSRNSSASR